MLLINLLPIHIKDLYHNNQNLFLIHWHVKENAVLLAFDILKIDKSYIREIGHAKNDEVLISAMINMAKSLGQHVVAEGIETQRQLDFLKEKGCELGQGFLFSQPVTAEDLVKKLMSNEFTQSIQKRMS